MRTSSPPTIADVVQGYGNVQGYGDLVYAAASNQFDRNKNGFGLHHRIEIYGVCVCVCIPRFHGERSIASLCGRISVAVCIVP